MARAKSRFKEQSQLTDAEREASTNTGLSPCFDDLLLAKPLPQTKIFSKLDLYYTGFFETVIAAIEFLELYTCDMKVEDVGFFDLKGLRAFFDCYERLAADIKLTPTGLSLDILIRQAETELKYPKNYLTGEVRRALQWAIDRRGDELGMLGLAVHKPLIIDKSVQVALDESHPDSFLERKSLMQFFNIVPVPKGASVNVNVQNNNNPTTIKGLPSFSDSLEAGQVSLKQLGDGAKQQDTKQLGSKQQDYIDIVEDEEQELILVEEQSL